MRSLRPRITPLLLIFAGLHCGGPLGAGEAEPLQIPVRVHLTDDEISIARQHAADLIADLKRP